MTHDEENPPSDVSSSRGDTTGKPNGKQRWSNRTKAALAIVSVLVVVVAAAAAPWYIEYRKWQITDNAYIKAPVARLSPGVPGHVDRVFVRNNQPVKAGQAIIRLSTKSLDAELRQAESNLGSSKSQVVAAEAAVDSAKAALQEGQAIARARQAEAEQARTEYRRFEKLESRAVSEQQRDQAFGKARSAEETAQAAIESTRSQETQIAQANAELDTARARVLQAEAQLSSASIRAQDATVFAPVDGIVTRFEVEPGDHVTPGESFGALVGTARWVEANFKEDQLRLIRVGQTVQITIDTWSEFVLAATVESVQQGSGAEFSALPPQNATSNWVKTVQRVPVRLRFTDNAFESFPASAQVLPGLSVEASVKVLP